MESLAVTINPKASFDRLSSKLLLWCMIVIFSLVISIQHLEWVNLPVWLSSTLNLLARIQFKNVSYDIICPPKPHPPITHTCSSVISNQDWYTVHTAQIHIHLLPHCSSMSMLNLTNSACGKPACLSASLSSPITSACLPSSEFLTIVTQGSHRLRTLFSSRFPDLPSSPVHVPVMDSVV